MRQIAFGAKKSVKDKRDHKDKDLTMAMPYPQKYDVDMSQIDVFYQKKIGVCTAAALAAAIVEYLYWKKTGKHTNLSVAFLYLVTKKIVDKNEQEGSSLRSALKAAHKFGICPESVFPTNVDLSHADFLAQKIPDNAWNEALNFTIGGYISIPVEESLVAAAVYKYGPLYARFEVGDKWFEPSWLEKDLDPITPSHVVISGHAVAIKGYDLSGKEKSMWVRNSWSADWFRKGEGRFYFRDYKPTEVWAVSLDSTMQFDEQPAVLSEVLRKVLDLFRQIGMIF